jgi:apolipoprotein N-acyltransferase
VLLALSFPKFGYSAFGWVALAPLLFALVRSNASGWRGFRLGLASGAFYFAGTLYWTSAVVETFGGVNPVLSVAAAGMLVAVLALFPGLFAGITAIVCRALGAQGLLVAPAIWVATELLRGLFLGGFPWELLGNSQVSVIPVVQIASVVGVYGVSALVALVSASLAYAALDRGREGIAVVGAAALLLAIIAIWGAVRVRDGGLLKQGEPIRVALVQGNIAQEQKWDATRAEGILKTYLSMTREAARRGATLVLWPESATPFFFEYEPAGQNAITSLVRSTGITLLLGSDQYEPGTPPRYYNAAFMLRPDGTTAAVYRKIHLVPFGEYIPLKRLLFFVAPLVEGASDFSPGNDVTLLPVGRHLMSTAICYEVVYPRLSGEATRKGSQLLSTITNDAWYGTSSAPHQHFTQAAMRAVEQGRYLIRAANTGISGIIDPYGRVAARSDIFVPTTIEGQVRFLDGLTIYGRTGDVFAYACALLTCLAWLACARRARATRFGVSSQT